ncbi:MAG: ABC transporter ATP-binding protein [Ruminococcaceae bacterium]|nr:ABC transporter ATP-binding protein [Oscillospiraceae bacterium]
MSGKSKRCRIKIIWRFAKPYIPLFVVAEICILVTYAVSLLLPLNLARLTDKVLYIRNASLLPDVIITYVVLFFASAISNLIYAYVWQTLSNRYVVDVKNEVFCKAMHAKVSFLSSMDSGDMMSRIDEDATQFIHIVQRNLFHFINSIILCSFIVFLVGRINIILAVALVIAAALPIIFTKMNSKTVENLAKKEREEIGFLTGKVFEIIKGLREIRLLCAEWWSTKTIFSRQHKILLLGNDIRKLDFVVNKFVYLINVLTTLIVYSISVYLVYSGLMTIGMFLAVIQYVALLHKKFNWMLRIYLDWFTRKVSVDRVSEILDTDSESDIGQPFAETIHKIQFKNVAFSFEEDNQVLKDISFFVEKGQKVAIVGANGVGKSTLVGLLLKFYSPDKGSILLNGKETSNLKATDIRKSIGVVQQDILLFDDTVRYNLLLGNEVCSDEKLKDVCRRVGLESWLSTLPMGLDTVLGNGAQGLSGGQKQRLMIARTLLKNAETVIFDEATSALDIDTENLVMEEFVKHNHNMTIIVISHRTEVIKMCDRIILLNEGLVEAVGTHEELLKESECYRKLFGV